VILTLSRSLELY